MKSLSIAALVMVGMLACVKETPQETTPEEAPGVKVTLSTTVSLAEDTKALTPTGVKTFAEGEQIADFFCFLLCRSGLFREGIAR